MVLSKDGQEYANEESDKASLTLLAVPSRVSWAPSCVSDLKVWDAPTTVQGRLRFFFSAHENRRTTALASLEPPFTDDLISGDFQAM